MVEWVVRESGSAEAIGTVRRGSRSERRWRRCFIVDLIDGF